MRLSAWTAALHHEFSLSVALSVALHGLVGIALGAFTLSTQMSSAPLEGLKVELVAFEPEPPAPSPALKLNQPEPRHMVEQALEHAPKFRYSQRVTAPSASHTEAFP